MGKPTNFIENPRGGSRGGSQQNVSKAMESRPQDNGSKHPELNQDSAIDGGKPLLPSVPATRAGDCTVKAEGSKKPFRVGG